VGDVALPQRIERAGAVTNLELGWIDGLLEASVVQSGNAGFNGVAEAIERCLGVGHCDALAD